MYLSITSLKLTIVLKQSFILLKTFVKDTKSFIDELNRIPVKRYMYNTLYLSID